MILRQSSVPNTIIFTNQKGGVGKTTLTREIGIYLATLGLEVLLVDCDSQGNLSKSLKAEGPGLFEALTEGEVNIRKITAGLSVLSGSVRLALLEKRFLGEIDAYERMSELFSKEPFTDFDFLLLDTPPSLGVLTVNALTAADEVVIPMNPSLYSMQGTNDLMATVAKVKRSLNPDLSILGVIINAFDCVPVITRQIRSEIEEAFGEKVFESVLSKSIRIEEAIAAGRGITGMKGREYRKTREEVAALGEELLGRIRPRIQVEV